MADASKDTAKKSSQQKKKDAQRAKAAIAQQLQHMAQAALRATEASQAPVSVVEEQTLGDVGARFEALVEQKFARFGGAAAAAVAAADGGDDVQDAAQNSVADAPTGPSKAQIRRTTRMSVDELKLLAPNPALVELHDANAPDPLFLVTIKCQRHSIPVPRHWIQKSLFLKNQVDREASDDIVPTFIENTGVAAMRPDNAKADPGQLARPFVAGHPKLPLTTFGDVFYEGKDMRARFRRFRPGVLSERLRQALGMTMNSPPPWLYGMQQLARLPPAYPSLKVPGLNAPLPSGCRWGRSRGEWGDPPRREDNSLVFPGVLRESDDVTSTLEAAVGSKTEYWGVIPDDTPLVVRTKAPASKPAAPATTTSAAAAPPPPAPAPFVPTASMLPQFPTMQGAQQTVFAEELQRYHTGYQGGGFMPSQYVFGAAGAAPPPPSFAAPGFHPTAGYGQAPPPPLPQHAAGAGYPGFSHPAGAVGYGSAYPGAPMPPNMPGFAPVPQTPWGVAPPQPPLPPFVPGHHMPQNGAPPAPPGFDRPLDRL